jgi:hypothetical protein
VESTQTSSSVVVSQIGDSARPGLVSSVAVVAAQFDTEHDSMSVGELVPPLLGAAQKTFPSITQRGLPRSGDIEPIELGVEAALEFNCQTLGGV